MLTVPTKEIRQTIAILGTDGIADSDIETRIVNLVEDKMVARRLIDWVPEAFGLVLISHLGKPNLPTTFSAMGNDGKWIQFEFKVEPVFALAVQLGTDIYHSGPRNLFSNIATRSAMVAVVNKVLNAGGSIDGSTLSGPALIGISAEVYGYRAKPFWRRFLRLPSQT